jgi:hypothetical protein
MQVDGRDLDVSVAKVELKAGDVVLRIPDKLVVTLEVLLHRYTSAGDAGGTAARLYNPCSSSDVVRRSSYPGCQRTRGTQFVCRSCSGLCN